MKAGAAHNPLDPHSPVARLQRIVDVLESELLIGGHDTMETAASIASRFEDVGLGRVDDPGDSQSDADIRFDGWTLDSAPNDPIDAEISPENLAYILFTSGSTGTPKGVPITHANASAFTTWANDYFGTGPDDRQSAHSPLHFDLSVYDMFGTFAAGAEPHLLAPELSLLPSRLDPPTDLVDLGLLDSLGFTWPFQLLEVTFGVVMELADIPSPRPLRTWATAFDEDAVGELTELGFEIRTPTGRLTEDLAMPAIAAADLDASATERWTVAGLDVLDPDVWELRPIVSGDY